MFSIFSMFYMFSMFSMFSTLGLQNPPICGALSMTTAISVLFSEKTLRVRLLLESYVQLPELLESEVCGSSFWYLQISSKSIKESKYWLASDPNVGFYNFQKYQQFKVRLPNLQVVKYTLILSAKKLFLYCGRAKSSGGAVRSIGEKKFTIPP